MPVWLPPCKLYSLLVCQYPPHPISHSRLFHLLLKLLSMSTTVTVIFVNNGPLAIEVTYKDKDGKEHDLKVYPGESYTRLFEINYTYNFSFVKSGDERRHPFTFTSNQIIDDKSKGKNLFCLAYVVLSCALPYFHLSALAMTCDTRAY
ncbi:hypothetical protein DFH11DRAFT_1671052 [Phellopilus nigrolimitatus]|nr:hypothetical protein DFH11DRAFT_1671052 [Phellopilus nigrolimitatus]